jgi:ADP-heptose:LPS heptosyltransferase
LKIIKDVRRRKFDFVLDLHSLYETNLLGFVSGAKHRLYANRENRSLDLLANFEPKPPREDKKLHLTDHYLNGLKPLGIENAPRIVEIKPQAKDLEKIETLLRDFKNKKLVGLFPGAGNPSRRWNLEKFAALAKKFSLDEKTQTIVFLGPEETDLRAEVEAIFPPQIKIVDKLSLTEFIAALSKMTVLVSNDTGAIHLAAIVGTPIVLIMDERAPKTYLPLTEKISVVNNAALDKISVEEVFSAMLKVV